MATSKVSFTAFLLLAPLIFAAAVQAQNLAPAPTSDGPSPAPTSDGVAIDQGIAYVLMLVALVLTYLIH
ncbi:hypothetical protein ACLOJK_014463 [Asimina triloba]